MIDNTGNSNFKTHIKSVLLPRSLSLHYNCISSSNILRITAITLCIRWYFIPKLKSKFQAQLKEVFSFSSSFSEIGFCKAKQKLQMYLDVADYMEKALTRTWDSSGFHPGPNTYWLSLIQVSNLVNFSSFNYKTDVTTTWALSWGLKEMTCIRHAKQASGPW